MPLTKILILEHDPNDLELLLHTLKKSDLNFVSEVVETREQYVLALHYFLPDIILSDFSLPSFDGLSAFNIKQDVCPETPLIIVSGTIGEENAVELIKKGVTDYVLKEKMYQVITKIQRALKEAEERLRISIAEQAVKLSEEKYRELFQLHPLPLWLFDVDTLGFLDVNEAALNHYGYSREEFMEMTIRDIRPQEDLILLDENLNLAKDSGLRSAGVFRHRKKDGQLIYAEITSNQFDYHGIKARLILANDITEKVEAEQRLGLSEKRFKALVQEGSDLISIIKLDGTYKYASPALASMIGKDPKKIIGLNAFQLIHPDDSEMITGLLQEIISAKRIQTSPFRYKDYTGEYRWLESVVTNLLDDPAVEGIVINSKDITESINHIHAIEEQNAKLREISWIQSHVVRAPLARIMGLVNLLTNHAENEEFNRELLGHITTSTNELDGIIREIVEKTDKVDDDLKAGKPESRKRSRV